MFLRLAFVLAFAHLASGIKLDGKPVPVELFVMSKCPDKVYCESVIADVLERVHVPVQLAVNYIATYNENRPFEHTCKHGDAECLGNIEQLCYRHVYPKQEDWFSFNQCVNKRYSVIGIDESLPRDCAHHFKKHYTPVKTCAASTLGIQLLTESAQRTQSLGISTSCTIYINNKPRCVRDGGRWKDCEEGSNVEDFVKTIENTFEPSVLLAE